MITSIRDMMGLFRHFQVRPKLDPMWYILYCPLLLLMKDKPRQCWHATEVSHSPAPHTQTSFSLGSPAVCTHSPVTPPESAASWFPPGCQPGEVENTHRDDYRDRRTHGSRVETLWALWYSAIWGFSCYWIIFLQKGQWRWFVLGQILIIQVNLFSQQQITSLSQRAV